MLSLDSNFTPFLLDGINRAEKSVFSLLQDFSDDDAETQNVRTEQHKVTHVELMFGQISSFCPVISRSAIVKNSPSLASVWQNIGMNFGFQTSGAHFLDSDSTPFGSDEHPDDLFQRLTVSIDDILITTDIPITHHGELSSIDEDFSPEIENLIVLTWLHLIHPDL